jgi:ParB-like chromosome segregation protein Spo0J
MNLSENVSRKELNIKEEAWACQRLLDFGITPDNVAKELGMSRGWLQCRQWLLELPNEIQDNCVIYSFTQSQIRELANAPNDEIRFQMSQKVIDARTKGIKITKIAKRVRPANKKLKPTYDEVLEMMDKVSKIIGYGIVTRGMAWCNGDLTDREFEADCAAAKGKVL